ncbi:invasion protein IalB [Rhizobium sp. WW_1]|jgi:invasion protein IalB|nr:invasion protein IalB [Rhizobium sp. WW_1]
MDCRRARKLAAIGPYSLFEDEGIHRMRRIGFFDRPRLAILLGAIVAGIQPVASSASAAPLPGGAGSLIETYQDWIVACQSQNNATQCVMRQTQSNKDNGQNILTVELSSGADGKLQAALLMPFGLALAQGVSVRIDDAPAGSPAAFSTCIPQGCLATITFDTGQLVKLKSGTNLNLSATALAASQPVALKVSLKGLSAALTRIGELTK